MVPNANLPRGDQVGIAGDQGHRFGGNAQPFAVQLHKARFVACPEERVRIVMETVLSGKTFTIACSSGAPLADSV